MNRVRVLHVITDLETGGAERMLLRLLRALPGGARGHAVVSLVGAGRVGPEIEAVGVPVRGLGMRPGVPSFGAFIALRRAVGRWRPHLLHGWMYHGCLAATLAARGRPVVWGVHHSLKDMGCERRNTRVVIRMLAKLSRRPATVLYCSATAVRQHAKLGFRPSDPRWIPNGFDCGEFWPDPAARERMRAELGIGSGEPAIGHLARFHAMKDHGTLFRAAGLLTRARPKVCFVLAGPGVGKQNGDLGALVRREGLEGRVRLLGERRDVPRLMNAFDLLVSSSSDEAFPLVLGEAMATGVPCVATDVGDSAAILGETGRVVPPRDPAALATALAELIDMDRTERERLGRAARQRIVDRYALPSVAAQYEALYREVAQASR